MANGLTDLYTEMINQILLRAGTADISSKLSPRDRSMSLSVKTTPAKADPDTRLKSLEKQSRSLAEQINKTKKEKLRAESRLQRKALQRQLRERKPEYERLRRHVKDLEEEVMEAKGLFEVEKRWQTGTKRELTRLEAIERRAKQDDDDWELSE